jgi:hypothetical protein
VSGSDAIDFADFVARRESRSHPVVRPRVWTQGLLLGVAVTYLDEVIIPRSWGFAGLPRDDPR